MAAPQIPDDEPPVECGEKRSILFPVVSKRNQKAVAAAAVAETFFLLKKSAGLPHVGFLIKSELSARSFCVTIFVFMWLAVGVDDKELTKYIFNT
jgi:hypothetical protein